MHGAPQKVRPKWGLLEEGSDHRDGGLLHLLRAGALRPDRGHPNRHNAIHGDVHHREALAYDVALFNLIHFKYIQSVALGCFQGFIVKFSWEFHWLVGYNSAAVQPGQHMQRSAKKYANFAKQDPGRARQSNKARAGRNFSQLRTSF